MPEGISEPHEPEGPSRARAGPGAHGAEVAPARVQDALAEVTALLRKARLVEGLIHEQHWHAPQAARDAVEESAVARQNKADLERTLARLHPADIAHLLEALPLDERLYVWDLVKADRDGDILVEASDAVRESLISPMNTDELVAATEALDAEALLNGLIGAAPWGSWR